MIPFNIVSKNNTFLPIISAIFGIIIFESDEHPEKALSTISLILFGTVIFVINKHFVKALSPIFIILSGNFISLSDKHPSKAYLFWNFYFNNRFRTFVKISILTFF